MNDENEGWDGADRRAKNGSVFERHLQTGFAFVIVSLTVWVGFTMVDLSKEQVRTSTQLMQVREDMKSLQEQAARANQDRFSSGAAIGAQLQRIENRLDQLERRK